MTLAKLMLGDDWSAVTLVAWANPDYHQAGDTDGAWSYVDVDMTDKEIDATKVPAAAGAVTLTDKQMGSKTVIDTPAVKAVLADDGNVLQAAKDAVTHDEPIILAGKLVVAADYVPAPEPTPVNPGPSAQDLLNADMMKSIAANTTANAAIIKELAAQAVNTVKEGE